MAWHGMAKTKKMGREVKLNGIQLGRKSSECAPLVAPRGEGRGWETLARVSSVVRK